MEARGLEPRTPGLQSRCSSQLSYAPGLQRNKEEKKEFIILFGQLIERTYMDKTRQYSGQKMNFINEEIDGKYGIVDAEVLIKNDTNITIQFRVMKKSETWFIYDVYVEGVSLVNNYRVQFNNILTKSDYGVLVSKLKAKLDK